MKRRNTSLLLAAIALFPLIGAACSNARPSAYVKPASVAGQNAPLACSLLGPVDLEPLLETWAGGIEWGFRTLGMVDAVEGKETGEVSSCMWSDQQGSIVLSIEGVSRRRWDSGQKKLRGLIARERATEVLGIGDFAVERTIDSLENRPSGSNAFVLSVYARGYEINLVADVEEDPGTRLAFTGAAVLERLEAAFDLQSAQETPTVSGYSKLSLWNACALLLAADITGDGGFRFAERLIKEVTFSSTCTWKDSTGGLQLIAATPSGDQGLSAEVDRARSLVASGAAEAVPGLGDFAVSYEAAPLLELTGAGRRQVLVVVDGPSLFTLSSEGSAASRDSLAQLGAVVVKRSSSM